MDKDRIIELYERNRDQLATPAEQAELRQLLQNPDAEKSLKDYWGKDWDRISAQDQELAAIPNYEQVFHHIVTQPQKTIPARRLWPRIAVAASITLAVCCSAYFLLHQKTKPQQTAQNRAQDIAPGHNQATLTLANGKKIILTKGLSGIIATQGKTTIQATHNDIAYNNTQQADQVNYNTLSTAKGEQSPYPLVLADGTKVWLNAESSITFPTAFNGKDRVVEVTGEAYFEVVHHSAQPFKVTTKGQTIEDIGTHFDVNAYDDEPAVRTTLMEGAVRIQLINTTIEKILSPGQQASVAGGEKEIRVSNANISEAIAWKDGYFRFSKTPLQALMRQIARWYDVQVVYEGNDGSETCTGVISRSDNLAKVLNIIGHGDVHYRIEGKKLILLP